MQLRLSGIYHGGSVDFLSSGDKMRQLELESFPASKQEEKHGQNYENEYGQNYDGAIPVRPEWMTQVGWIFHPKEGNKLYRC
jgi:hypothetical protein